MSEHDDSTGPDPRDLIRERMKRLEAKAAEIEGELAHVNAELKRYRAALAALDGDAPVKRTVTRDIVRGEAVAILGAAPEGILSRKKLDEELRTRLRAAGYKLNGIERRTNELLSEPAFQVARGQVSLSGAEG